MGAKRLESNAANCAPIDFFPVRTAWRAAHGQATKPKLEAGGLVKIVGCAGLGRGRCQETHVEKEARSGRAKMRQD